MSVLQKEFDAIVKHLYKQGRPAKDINTDLCVLKNDKGHMCAVGCRIPKNIYDEDMEGDSSISTLISEFDMPAKFTIYEDFYANMQDVHDMCKINKNGTFNKLDLKNHLLYVSNRYNLKLNIPS